MLMTEERGTFPSAVQGWTPAASLPPRKQVLIVEDEPGIRQALQAHFLREGWQARTAASIHDAEMLLGQEEEFDLLVSDVRLGDGSGVDLLRSHRSSGQMTPFILLTAFATIPDAVEAMRMGASDYLTKPVVWKQLSAVAGRVTLKPRADLPVVISAPTTAPLIAGACGIVGRSPALLQALDRARAAASTGADVLVEAESGTGKEMLARFIHDASDRARKPFVAINCAAVPEHLMESELFGHARGAFTGAMQARPGRFELADGGTLLLDEIGEMPLHLQAKLLRALQEREFERLGDARTVKVDIRVIATTNVTLQEAVERGQFRSDLYYRLNVIPLTLPPLRDRREDIRPLAEQFAVNWAAQTRRPVPLLTADFLESLEAQPWPGNVRELSNFMQRVLSLHAPGLTTARIDKACFLREAGGSLATRAAQAVLLQASAQSAATEVVLPPVAALPALPIRQLERLHLEKTLAMTQGNRTHAAEMLGISLRTMRNKIREYGLPPRSYA